VLVTQEEITTEKKMKIKNVLTGRRKIPANQLLSDVMDIFAVCVMRHRSNAVRFALGFTCTLLAFTFNGFFLPSK
jgi:hypothetical protein